MNKRNLVEICITFMSSWYAFHSSIYVCFLTFATNVSGGGHETTEQVVTRCNNYETICTGLYFQNVRCDAGKEGKSMTH